MSQQKWTEKKCVPCEGGMPPLGTTQVAENLKDLNGWRADAACKAISVEYVMKNFLAAVNLIQKIAELAESEDHHPDLHLTGYRKLRVDLSTHAIGGLSENDFIVAAKIDPLPKELKS